MDIRQILWELRKVGCSLFVGEDGVVHGKMMRGYKMPLEARALAQELQLRNEEAKAAMALEETDVYSFSEWDGEAGKARKRKEEGWELAGPVWVDRKADTVTVIYRRVLTSGEVAS